VFSRGAGVPPWESFLGAAFALGDGDDLGGCGCGGVFGAGGALSCCSDSSVFGSVVFFAVGLSSAGVVAVRFVAATGRGGVIPAEPAALAAFAGEVVADVVVVVVVGRVGVHGVRLAETKDTEMATGVDFVDFVVSPGVAIVVRVPGASVDAVSSLGEIREVGCFVPVLAIVSEQTDEMLFRRYCPEH